jgi:hypothetical protein
MWNNNASGAVLFSTTSTPNTSSPDRLSTCYTRLHPGMDFAPDSIVDLRYTY